MPPNICQSKLRTFVLDKHCLRTRHRCVDHVYTGSRSKGSVTKNTAKIVLNLAKTNAMFLFQFLGDFVSSNSIPSK
jgi:hypothetical protein